MTKRWFVCTMAIFLTLLTAGAPSIVSAQQDSTIRIAVEGKFPPFNYVGSNGDLQGFDVEIANALCDAMSAKCELVMQEWDSMIPALLDKKYDAIVSSMSMSVERREKVAFSHRYYDSPTVFITSKTSPALSFTSEGLSGQRLGVTLSTAQEAYAKHFFPDLSIVVFDASPELYEGLANGQVDLILEDKLAAYDWLSNTKAGACCEFRGDDIKDPTYFGDGAGIAVRKEDTNLLQSFDKALDVIVASGAYQMINAKYFPFSIY